jgi:hypothetical protein
VLAVGVSVRSDVALPCGLRPLCSANVLYLDWETNATVQQKRIRWIARGLGVDVPPILYRPMYRALGDDVERIRKEVHRHAVGLVIVDSIAPACGGEPENAETINRFFNALRSLAPATRLVVSHVSHAGANAKGAEAHPFGSIFVRNLARSVWELRRSDDVGRADAMNVALYHRKVNDGPKLPPMGFEIVFDDRKREIRFGSLDVAADSGLAAHASLPYRVRAALRKGAMKTDQLSQFLDVPEKSLLVTIGRMPDVQKMGGGLGRGNVATWGLIRQTEEGNDDDLPF